MITDHFEAGGSLSKILPEYEYRQSQAELARTIERCLNRGDLGFFEAGTGTGKSLAYLIPAASYAMRHQKPVVISTHTISLQQQLVEKDIPLVQQIYPELKAVLVKGWRNYVCHLRLGVAMQASGNLLDTTWDDRLTDIYSWSKTTKDGTIADLDFEPDPALWDEVCAESDSCLRVQCPHYDQCPLFRDRAMMAKAHLLIVNHHLLFADVSIRRAAGWHTDHAVLPTYAAVVIDESHHVEDVATDHLGTMISSVGVARLFGRIFRRRGKEAGLIPGIKKQLLEAEVPVDQTSSYETQAALAFAEAEQQLQDFFDAVTGWSMGRWEDNTSAGPSGQTSKIRRISPHEAMDWERQVNAYIDRAQKSLGDLRQCITEMVHELPAREEPAVALRAQADGVRRRIEGLEIALDAFGELHPTERVYWIEKFGRRQDHIRLVSAPIDVGESFVEWVKAACSGLVLVSATLAVSGSFDYTKERLGVGNQREIDERMEVHEHLFTSPFNYPDQVLLGVLSDLPAPTDPAYAVQLPQAVLTLLKASRGRALVLFTSISMLRRVKAALEEPLRQSGLTLLAQGDAPRYRLLEAFKADAHSVLLGTDSFWEGVDVPGEALSTVIVTRLPFDVPTEPVAEARAERLKSIGRSPFQHYMLPRSALKLKQGFGRLIRTQSDRGAVIVCDRRVIEKSYGQVLLDALPPARPIVADTAKLATFLTSFLG